MLRFSPRALAAGSLLLVLALVPLYAQWQGEPFLLALFGRVLVYGIAALALNLLLGYGGMVSFGHALYLGLGAYAVGVLRHHGIENGWLHLAAALGACALVGLVSGYVVADYSRYLPSRTSSARTFLAVGLGSVAGAQIAMVLGVLAAAMAPGQFAGREVAYIVGLGGPGTIAALLYFSIAFGKITISTLNSYGSFMCIATIISGFRGSIEVTHRQRVVAVLLIVGAATAVALIGQHSFLGAFKSFILFLLAFFTPWSAVNLVDYYFVNRERYDVPALADPDGRYGRWNMTGLTAYAVGVLVQMPFISTKLYTGPLVQHLGGVDISWIIGLIVPGILYYLLARNGASAARRHATSGGHDIA